MAQSCLTCFHWDSCLIHHRQTGLGGEEKIAPIAVKCIRLVEISGTSRAAPVPNLHEEVRERFKRAVEIDAGRGI